MSLLEVRGLDVSLSSSPAPVRLVSELGLDIDSSEVFGLAGESGCGKSISALSIMGIQPASVRVSGKVSFRGRDLLSLDGESRRRLRGNEMSMIFQEPMTSLNPVLTVGRQIAEPLMIHKGMSRRDAAAKAVELLKAVMIPSPQIRVNEYPHQMSGGMRQRVMIAMAIACGPSLLIADEPTTALDVTIQAQILELIQRLREEQGMSILLITHDLGIIAENASRAAIMYAGRIMESAPASDMFASPLHPYTRGLLDSLPGGRGKRLNPIPGFVPSPEELPPGCKYESRCAYAKPYCSDQEPELREVSPGRLVRCLRSGEI